MEENEKFTNEEILRQQLELLAERSKNTTDDKLSQITLAMIEIYHALQSSCKSIL